MTWHSSRGSWSSASRVELDTDASVIVATEQPPTTGLGRVIPPSQALVLTPKWDWLAAKSRYVGIQRRLEVYVILRVRRTAGRRIPQSRVDRVLEALGGRDRAAPGQSSEVSGWLSQSRAQRPA